MQLTILCDNTVAARPGLIGEHGFACHIATDGKQYLFDTGNGVGLLKNATSCGIDLSAIDAVLLSHGHWDHCGGLLELLKLRDGRPTPVYAHPGIFADKVSRGKAAERAIGTGFNRNEAEAVGADFLLSASPVELTGGLVFSGEIPRRYESVTDSSLCYRQTGELRQDPLLDDQSLYLQSDSGLVVLCGCAHAGVRNILAHAESLVGMKKLYALIGGLHLSSGTPVHINPILEDLHQREVQLLAGSHCTGPEAITQLMNSFGSAVTSGVVSSSYIF